MSVRIEARNGSSEDYVNAINCPDEDAETIVSEWTRIYDSVTIINPDETSDESPVDFVTNPAFGIQE